MKIFTYISTFIITVCCSLMLSAQPDAEQWVYYTHGMGDSLTLPVELIHFTASEATGTILLSWSTATESNNDFYTIQQSKDGTNYTTISIAEGAGNSNEITNYQYTDDAAIEGICYYRLMQTDFDGSTVVIGYTWYKMNSSYMNNPVIILNQMERSIKLSVYSEKNQHVNVVLYDENGKEMFTSEMEAIKGMNQFNINTAGVSKGIYIYRLNINNDWFSGKIYVN
jgi:hypothetical protein